MSITEFMAKLEATPREWCLRRVGNTWRLRLGVHCPLSAVAYTRPSIVTDAQQALNIAKSAAWQIANAADGWHGHDRELRKRLKKACGLR
jgi:hypothetical protein